MVELRTFCREIRGYVRRGDRIGPTGMSILHRSKIRQRKKPPPNEFLLRRSMKLISHLQKI